MPEGLKGLAYRNAAEVRSGRDFRDHVDRLIRGIEHLLRPKELGAEGRRRARTGESRQSRQRKEPRPGEIVTNSLGMKFAWIPPGTFLMGSPANEPERSDDETQHGVTLTKGFHLGIYQVTRAQWQAVMGANPSNFKGESNLPVENVSWHDCVAFCGRWARRTARPTACRRRRIGSTPAAPGRPRRSTSATRSPSIKPITIAIIPMAPTRRGSTARRQHRWAASRQTPGVCTTCTATSGSGARIGTAPIQKRI